MAQTVSVAKQVRAALDRYEPAIVELVTAARRTIRRRYPSAVELVYDNYNALVFGYGPSERASEAPFSLAAYPRWLNLFFLQGARLPDPHRLLQGSGRLVRSIRLESAAQLDAAPVRELFRAAVEHMTVPFADGRGRTVIRATAAVRRPRRPRGQGGGRSAP